MSTNSSTIVGACVFLFCKYSILYFYSLAILSVKHPYLVWHVQWHAFLQESQSGFRMAIHRRDMHECTSIFGSGRNIGFEFVHQNFNHTSVSSLSSNV